MLKLEESVIGLSAGVDTGVGVFEIRDSIQILDDPSLKRTLSAMQRLGVLSDSDKRFVVELEMELEKRKS